MWHMKFVEVREPYVRPAKENNVSVTVKLKNDAQKCEFSRTFDAVLF